MVDSLYNCGKVLAMAWQEGFCQGKELPSMTVRLDLEKNCLFVQQYSYMDSTFQARSPFRGLVHLSSNSRSVMVS